MVLQRVFTIAPKMWFALNILPRGYESRTVEQADGHLIVTCMHSELLVNIKYVLLCCGKNVQFCRSCSMHRCVVYMEVVACKFGI